MNTPHGVKTATLENKVLAEDFSGQLMCQLNAKPQAPDECPSPAPGCWALPRIQSQALLITLQRSRSRVLAYMHQRNPAFCT